MELFKILTVAVTLLTLAQAGVVPILLDEAEEFVCPPNASGAFAHQTDCDKYYLCNNGTATLFSCQEGLYYDIDLKVCNFAEFVDCTGRVTPAPTTTTTQAPTQPPVTGDYEFECPSAGGAFPHDIYCEKYFICVNNEATEKTCPEGQLYDLKYDGCNFAELVYCGDRLRPNGTVTMQPTIVPSVTPDPGYTCPQPGGAFPHDENCELYYLCVEDVPSLEICPVDQLFDTVWAGCNWAELVDCGDRIRPNGTVTAKPTTTTKSPGTGPTEAPGTGPTNAPPGDFECPEFAGIFPDPADCSAFYLCDNYVGNQNFCQSPLLFNDIAQVCDFPANVDCGSRPKP